MAEKTSRVRVARIPKKTVRTAFDPQSKVTKHQIAEIVAAYYTELRFQVPPPRKIWMSEDERMSIFSAVAMAMVVMYGSIYEGEIT
ncbi:MAG: hypothetical protein COV99_12520 [Bacteroidetes bacterium CG12_big_fil_rev_8_21_14_0_65_60_17]|nr:MAG: hypothetical protein COV99_12520 [Bacteroidetes bacterium CG12_big_fil_rev_8_21_14_0_65_60_17]